MARTRRSDPTAKRVTPVVIPRSKTLEMLKRSIEAPKGVVNVNTVDGLAKVNEGILYDLANGAPLDELRMLRQSASDQRKLIAMMMECGVPEANFFSNALTLRIRNITPRLDDGSGRVVPMPAQKSTLPKSKKTA